MRPSTACRSLKRPATKLSNTKSDLSQVTVLTFPWHLNSWNKSKASSAFCPLLQAVMQAFHVTSRQGILEINLEMILKTIMRFTSSV
jgi:hypothetical protein